METKTEIKLKIQAYLAENTKQIDNLGEDDKFTPQSLCVSKCRKAVCNQTQALVFLNQCLEYDIKKNEIFFDKFSLPEAGHNILGWIYPASEGYYFIQFKGNQLYLIDRSFYE